VIILEDIGPTVTGGKDGSCFPEDRSATTYLKYTLPTLLRGTGP